MPVMIDIKAKSPYFNLAGGTRPQKHPYAMRNPKGLHP